MTNPDLSASTSDFGWAIVVMRVGYLGRALVYLTVAGLSLWAIAQGGHASGTSDALSRIESIAGGLGVLTLICAGMVSYAIWRIANSLYDLEGYGTDLRGVIARLGMVATGAIHLGIGAVAASLILNLGGGGTSISGVVAQIMDLPGGRWLIGIAGGITVASGVYYLHKGWTRSYRGALRANAVTQHATPVLTFGITAQGIIVAAVGALFSLAALRRSPGDAGGLGEVFSWAYSTPYGALTVAAICLGLLAFAVFCVVNAVWRIVPKADGPDIETLAAVLRAKAAATGG